MTVSYKSFDDGSFYITQDHVIDGNLVLLKFGPLIGSIAWLFTKGYILRVDSYTNREYHGLYLVNSNNHKERYKICSIKQKNLQDDIADLDLCDWIKDNTKPQPAHITLQDPFDQLLSKYKPTKSVKYIGNLTLKEYVKQQLNSKRKYYVK